MAEPDEAELGSLTPRSHPSERGFLQKHVLAPDSGSFEHRGLTPVVADAAAARPVTER